MRRLFWLRACRLPEHKVQSLAHDLAIMRDAARAGGQLALDYLARRNGPKSWTKDDNSLVTEADLAVNELLGTRLMAARPDYGWLSEETADDRAARQKHRVWVVDPIDGTRAYVRGNDPHWCVALAVIEDGVAVASVIYAPAFDELYEARIGGGAYLNGTQIFASKMSEETGARLITNRAMIDHPAWPTPWPKVVVSTPKPNATLYRMALVAAGRWDGTLALFRKFDWDLAAGAVLVGEAGGLVSTHLGETLRFNQHNPAQRSLVAAGKLLHPLLVERVKHVDLPEPNAKAGQ